MRRLPLVIIRDIKSGYNDRYVRAQSCGLYNWKGSLSMSKRVWLLIALTGAVAGCGGSPPLGSAAVRSGSLENQRAVCQMENPGYAGSGITSPCAQVCVASGNGHSMERRHRARRVDND